MKLLISLIGLFTLSCINMDDVIEAGTKAKDKYEKFDEANPDFVKNVMSGDTAKIAYSLNNFKGMKTEAQKAREDSIAALEEAEQDSILQVMKESFIDELYKKYGSKKDTIR
tara:strand:+ start:163 stop:498 length:336 start_codon:yes stop_codon:yes gene_type:complete